MCQLIRCSHVVELANKSSKSKALVSDDLSDIFAPSVTKLPTSGTVSVPEKKSQDSKKPVLDDDDADIFADSLLSKSRKPVARKEEVTGVFRSAKEKVKPAFFDDDDDDDDIFAVKTKPAAAATGSVKPVSAATKTKVNDYDDDDVST